MVRKRRSTTFVSIDVSGDILPVFLRNLLESGDFMVLRHVNQRYGLLQL